METGQLIDECRDAIEIGDCFSYRADPRIDGYETRAGTIDMISRLGLVINLWTLFDRVGVILNNNMTDTCF